MMQSLTAPHTPGDRVEHASGPRSETEPAVSVSMSEDHVVICPPAHLDLETTEVLVVAAASAVTSGSTVLIDLDPETTSDELIARRPLSDDVLTCVTSESGPVRVLGAGFVSLATRDAHWTIDLTRGRLCRSDGAVDPHFVVSGNWTPVQALWVTSANVTAPTTDGTYLSTQAVWSSQTLSRRAVAS